MKTFLTLSLSLALFLLARGAALAGTQDFTLVNKTGLDIAEVYVSPSDSNDWEEDVLGDNSLDDGEEVTIHFNRDSTAAKWDLRIVDEDGDAVVWKGFNLLKVSKITLYYKDKKPTADIE